MLADHKNIIETHRQHGQNSVRRLQAPLREEYEKDPNAAWIIDSARASSDQVNPNYPVHGHVVFGTGVPASQAISAHKAVGGESDFPCPGEALAAAIASCLDISTRMVANLLGIKLLHLEVTVDLGIDVRGTLMMDRTVPVGFQQVDIAYNLKAANDVTEEQLQTLMTAAERSCVILETVKNPPRISVQRNAYFK
ncbi:OsmC family protein [Sneathiella aquimaris]|uniref:OsmC family protein n=1 Tax=Sneathiella aquimaris TaxID=2599305 RepID=UPI001469D374|nr:OsmC family protein [Sneathiella aquimaris]